VSAIVSELQALQARVARLEDALRALLQYANRHEEQRLSAVDDAMWEARQVLDAPPSGNT
jgi:hypothetical protein